MAIPGASSVSPVTEAGSAESGKTRRIEWQEARIETIAPLTPRIMSFIFAPSRPFSFRAGQHVDLRLTAPDGYRAERSYSIASGPGTPDRIELAIERIEEGEVSPFFHEIAMVGDDFELRGPIGGHFVWGPEDGGPLLLMGGGSGVVPLVSMLRHRSQQGSRVPAMLVLSARTSEDVLFRDELLALADRRDGFELVLTLTQESAPRAADFRRRIDASMLSEVLPRLPAPPRFVFACGTNGFVENAAASAIAAGVPPSIIRTERFGG